MPSPTQPNIMVIWGDDIGVYNVSAYHRGLMGGSTPNIDRIAQEGVIFTDHYHYAQHRARPGVPRSSWDIIRSARAC